MSHIIKGSMMSHIIKGSMMQSCIQAAPLRDLRNKFVIGPTFNDGCAHSFSRKSHLALALLVDGPIHALTYVYFAKIGGTWYRWKAL